MNNKLLLALGAGLLLFGLFKPNFNFPISKPDNTNIVVVTPPESSELRDKCKLVRDVFQDSTARDKKQDARRLSDLCMDLATLVELDGDEEVVKTTEEIRQANALSGAMLRMNIKGKYPGLSDGAQLVISSQIGDDIAPLNSELRKKAADAFRALAWACNEESK
jgi:hypothetical protein